MKNFQTLSLLVLIIVAGVFNACEEEDDSVYISLNEKYVAVEEGLTFQYVASITGPGASKVNKEVTWTIDKNDFVTIDQNGLVTGLKMMDVSEGLATVTASIAGGEYITSNVRIIKPDPKISRVKLGSHYLFTPAVDTFITATVLPIDIIDKYDVSWQVDDEEVIAVDSTRFENGQAKIYLTPLKPGQANVKLMVADQEFNSTVYVGSTVTLSWQKIYMGVETFKVHLLRPGTEMELKLYSTMYPDDDLAVANMKYDWRIEGNGGILKNIHRDEEDKRIVYATVLAGDLNGVFNVVVSANHGQDEIQAEIVVREKYPIEDLQLTYSASEVDVGGSLLADFNIVPVKATNDWKDDIVWKSSDLSILEVDENGTVKGVSAGDATVTVMINEKSISYDFKVKPTVDYLTMTSGVNVLMVDDTNTWTAEIFPETVRDNFDIAWSSDNEEIATVNSETGEITAVSSGKVIITAKAGEKSITRELKVIETISALNFTLNDESEYEVIDGMISLFVKSNDQNYEFSWAMNTMTNGTFAVNDGNCIFKSLNNYTLNTLSANVIISDASDLKRIVIEGKLTRPNGMEIQVNVEVESFNLDDF